MIIISDANVSFVMTEYSVAEDAGSVSVCVDSGVTGGFQADLTVSLSATDGTACEDTLHHLVLSISDTFYNSVATAIGDDTGLTAAEFTVVFPANSGDIIRCSNISITDDEILEGYHDFTVTVTGAGSHALVNAVSSVTTVTITDDEGE